ncbi:sulfatase [Haloferula helveola]|uniref:Sulfatase n=2 Tax=Haloferula helveola TaxID=490095 RepID=A0ABM7RCP9_9BACT|nr:sulfatase [Haloferula helveola]
MRRKLLFLLVGLLALPLRAADKPNILLIFIDDMGAVDLGCFGSSLYRTPNIDRLATEGVRFTGAYAACHVCSPTRASLQTGIYPARLHITDWLTGHKKPTAKLKVPDWRMEGLSDADVTLGEILGEQGYATAWLGKWHLGNRLKKGKEGAPGPQSFGYDAGGEEWNLNKKEDGEDPKGVFTLTREAQEFIGKHRDQPWFVGLSHYSVHTPVRFNRKLKAEYDEIVKEKSPRQKNAGYAAMVEALDESVGQLLKWLDQQGLSENTLVIFFSDNGGLVGPTDNTPLRAGKGTLYEGGTRVPMIVRWPGKAPAGTTSDARFCSIDFVPTLGAITGAKVPDGVDGLDFTEAWKGGKAPERDALYWHYPHYHKGMPGGSVVKGDWKLIEWFETGDVELYNLVDDPSEKRDLSEKKPELAKSMLADLKAWRKDVGAQMMTANPNHKPGKRKR